jgi:hypothetical protein
MKVTHIFTVWLVALFVGFSVAVGAQEMSQPSGAVKEKTPTMAQMMKQCHEHCSQATQSMKQLDETVQKAEQSNDPGQMRTALNEVHKSIGGMESHMDRCMNMMGMMENMHGMKGMMGSSGGTEGSGGMMGGMNNWTDISRQERRTYCPHAVLEMLA